MNSTTVQDIDGNWVPITDLVPGEPYFVDDSYWGYYEYTPEGATVPNCLPGECQEWKESVHLIETGNVGDVGEVDSSGLEELLNSDDSFNLSEWFNQLIDGNSVFSFVVWALVALVVLLLLFNTFFIVRTQMVYVVERFGRFHRMASAGLNVKIPFIDRIVAKISLRVLSLESEVSVKTKDNVNVILCVSVQYQVQSSEEADERKQFLFAAAYKLTDEKEQINSYVQASVRAITSKLTLDEVFTSIDEIASSVGQSLSKEMSSFGYSINQALVTEVELPESVEEAMNSINAAERDKVAAESEAAATKIRLVGKAAGEAEARKLRGEGLANERREIVNGLVDQHGALKKAGVTNADQMLMLSQYTDTMQAMAGAGQSSVIFMPSGPAGMTDLMTAIQASMTSGAFVNEHTGW